MFYYAYNYFKRNKNRIIKFYIIYLLTIVISISIPFFSGKFIDVILLKNFTNQRTALYLLLAYIMLLLLNVFLSYFVKVNGYLNIIILSNEMKLEIINQIFNISLEKSQKFEPGYLLSRISQDSQTFIIFFLNNFLNIISKSIILIFSIFILYKINHIFFTISVCFIPIYIFLYKYIKNEYSKKNRIYIEMNDVFSSCLLENLVVTKEIKMNSCYDKINIYINNNYNNFFSAAKSFLRYSERFKSIDALVAVIFQIITLIISSYLIINSRMTLGEFTILNSYFAYLLESLRFYAQFGKSYQEVKVAFERISELLDIKVEDNGSIILHDIKTIKLENISFGYDKNNSLYNQLNFKFVKGNSYCIKGYNGKGKTTLINILCGIIKNGVSGNILYNDINIKILDLIELRRMNIAVMTQETKFQNCSVEFFLLLGSPIQMIEKTIKNYELDMIYLNDNFNINQILTKRMSQLSGGEKQKVCLLRALMKVSNLLILDEPTASLDIASSNILINKLSIIKKNKIVIIITHDEKLANACEIICKI